MVKREKGKGKREKGKGTKRQDSRFAQPKAARRAMAMGGLSE